jgi:hypothetical protein
MKDLTGPLYRLVASLVALALLGMHLAGDITLPVWSLLAVFACTAALAAETWADRRRG